MQRATVLQWLTIAYQHVYGTPFKEPEQQDAAAQSSQTSMQQPAQQPGRPGTFTSMARLLLFADAVGCAAPLLRACAAGVDKLLLRVQLPTGPVDLSISTAYYWDFEMRYLMRATEQLQVGGTAAPRFTPAEFAGVQATLRQQVQAQSEVLLYAAYKLQLVEAAAAVEDFVRLQSSFAASVLRGALRPVLSQRVLDAAAGFRSLQVCGCLVGLLAWPGTSTRFQCHPQVPLCARAR